MSLGKASAFVKLWAYPWYFLGYIQALAFSKGYKGSYIYNIYIPLGKNNIYIYIYICMHYVRSLCRITKSMSRCNSHFEMRKMKLELLQEWCKYITPRSHPQSPHTYISTSVPGTSSCTDMMLPFAYLGLDQDFSPHRLLGAAVHAEIHRA